MEILTSSEVLLVSAEVWVQVPDWKGLKVVGDQEVGTVIAEYYFRSLTMNGNRKRVCARVVCYLIFFQLMVMGEWVTGSAGS